MAYVDTKIPGLAYGAAEMSVDGAVGQFVKVDGDNSLALSVGGTTADAIGILAKNAATGEKAVVLANGGIYETDAFETGVVAGEPLEIDATSKLLTTASTGVIVARALAVESGVLTFKLLI